MTTRISPSELHKPCAFNPDGASREYCASVSNIGARQVQGCNACVSPFKAKKHAVAHKPQGDTSARLLALEQLRSAPRVSTTHTPEKVAPRAPAAVSAHSTVKPSASPKTKIVSRSSAIPATQTATVKRSAPEPVVPETQPQKKTLSQPGAPSSQALQVSAPAGQEAIASGLIALPDGKHVTVSATPEAWWNEDGGVGYVDPRLIAADPDQPRKRMHKSDFEELKQSVADRGVRQHLVVTPREKTAWATVAPRDAHLPFINVSGHRRARAAYETA